MCLTYLSFVTTNELGPLTRMLLNVAENSGPRLNCILSNGNGSSGIVLTPSPKSPFAKFGRSLLISSKIHFSIAGEFLEHVFINDAENGKKILKFIKYL